MKHLPLQKGIIYGPIRSRRIGRSLGINLLPQDFKLCSFDCVYCQYGPTVRKRLKARAELFPSLEEVAKELETTLKKHKDLDAITFSGNGEPTLYPQLREVIQAAKALRDRYAPGVPLAMLSSSATVHIPQVREALCELDRPIMKLDAGDPKTFAAINRPAKAVKFERIVEGLATLPDVTLQVMLLDGPDEVENISESKLAKLVEVISEIRPKEVMLYSVVRPPAEAFVREVPKEQLKEIARTIRRKTGIQAQAF